MDGMTLIIAERRRQVEVEGWTPEHDDKHGGDALMAAAHCYRDGNTSFGWPWAPEWWKPKGRPRNLVRAGALYLAAIECFERTQHTKWSLPHTDIASVVGRCHAAAGYISNEINEWLNFALQKIAEELRDCGPVVR